LTVVLVAAVAGWTLGGSVFGGSDGPKVIPGLDASINGKDWKKDTDKISGLTIYHPKAWKVGKASSAWVLYLDSESVAKNGGFRRNIVVQSEEYAGSLTEYSALAIGEFQKLGGPQAVVEQANTVVNGVDARSATYTFPDRVNNKTDKSYAVWTLKDGVAYVITYTSEASAFSEQLQMVTAAFQTAQLP
jgi:hypothetical protein